VIVRLEGGVGWEEDGEIVAAAELERDGDRLVIRSLTAERPGADESLMRTLAEMANVTELVAPGDEPVYRLCGFEERDGCWTLPLDTTPMPTRAFRLSELEAAVRAAWSAETADNPEKWHRTTRLENTET